jgi:hypothetical protein
MANGKPRDQRKEQQWRRWIRKWQASDVTARAFCQAHGLSEASFYGWRRELDRRDADRPYFVPVHLVGDEPQAVAGAVDLLLPGNRTVRVAPGFDTGTLQRLLAVLEDKPC